MEPAAVAIKIVSNKWLYFIRPLSMNLYCLYFITPVFLAVFIWGMEVFNGFWIVEKAKALATNVKQNLHRLFNLLYHLEKLLIADGNPFFVL